MSSVRPLGASLPWCSLECTTSEYGSHMAYPHTFLRLVASGTLYEAERFSWSMSLIPNFDNTPDVPETIPQGVIDAVRAFHISSGLISGAARLTTLKVNQIGTDGRYVDQNDTVQYDWTTSVPGSASSVYTPPQIALAVSLRTGVRRGLAHTGRFYLPTPAFVPNADGRITTAQAQSAATATTTFLNALHAALPGWRAGVVSDVGAGAARAVTHVEVGRVLDTIRSRRTSLPEAHERGADLGP